MNTIQWLANWYTENCNGDWEHNYGIKIDTIDNPGWVINIDLLETRQEGKKVSITVHVSEYDWYDIVSDGVVFVAHGDDKKLQLLIEKFKEFVEND